MGKEREGCESANFLNLIKSLAMKSYLKNYEDRVVSGLFNPGENADGSENSKNDFLIIDDAKNGEIDSHFFPIDKFIHSLHFRIKREVSISRVVLRHMIEDDFEAILDLFQKEIQQVVDERIYLDSLLTITKAQRN